ncbi:MAG: alpha-L-arabinofuranosidase C-terminal domain-containing protein, partial [Flavisolibacter sp.]
HADRVRLANLAQTVNVLQALVLTKGAQMLLTPTYYVFDLYKVHQNAKLIPIQFNSPDYVNGDQKIPALNISASRDSTGAVHVSLVNIDANHSISIQTNVDGSWKSVTGRILTSDKINDYNSFDQPNKVVIKAFNGAKLAGNKLTVDLPAKSVVVIELK